MKSILLTTTALVAFAGAAAADGHLSVTWSGTATAGVARDGGEDGQAEAVDATIESLIDGYDGAFMITPEDVSDAVLDVVDLLSTVDGAAPSEDVDDAVARARANVANIVELYTAAEEAGLISSGSLAAAAAQAGAHTATADQLFGTADDEVGDFEEYAEINLAVTGTVATDLGVSFSATVSVDAGRGYDFADDDGFDSSGAQDGSVGFDGVVVDAGAFGMLTIEPDDLEHLVDDDDDDNADIKYENDFGVAKLTFVMDIDEDTDVTPQSQSWALVDATDLGDIADNAVVLSLPGVDTTGGLTPLAEYEEDPYGDFLGLPVELVYNPAVAADVQWSAKVEAPIADIATVYAAFDEEGGYDVGASATIEGITVDASAKSEALAVENEEDTEFEVGASYSIAGLTVGATYNSIDDGDQWGISGSFSQDGITIAASTDEGEDWEITGEYALSDNASIEGGVNYTEDAFVGVSFSF